MRLLYFDELRSGSGSVSCFRPHELGTKHFLIKLGVRFQTLFSQVAAANRPHPPRPPAPPHTSEAPGSLIPVICHHMTRDDTGQLRNDAAIEFPTCHVSRLSRNVEAPPPPPASMC